MLIDRGGLARPFVLGIGLFSVGLLIGGLAPSMEVLVVARVIQGFGAGAIPAVAYVSIGRALPETPPAADVRHAVDRLDPARRHRPDRGRPSSTEIWHWRVVFLGLLPLIAIAASLTLPSIAAVAPARDADASRPPSATPRPPPIGAACRWRSCSSLGAGLIVVRPVGPSARPARR